MRPVRWLVVVVIGIYAVSFVLPTMGERPGVWAFDNGLLMLWRDPAAGVGWLANPAFWCGAYFCATQRWSKAVWAGAGASLLALSGGFALPGLGLGYYVWLASMVLLNGVGLIGLLGPPGRGVDGRIPEQKR